MMRITGVLDYPSEADVPRIGINTTDFGIGKVCAVQFSDALAELEQLHDSAAPQHESQWQPIETAPKDCNSIRFGRWWSDEQGWMKEPVIGRWNQKTDGRWEFANAGGWWGIRPTVWTPLPQHPDTIKVPRPEGHDSWSIEITSSCGGGGGKPHDTPKDK